MELNPADGTETSLFSFTGTSHTPEYSMAQVRDFRVSEDGSVEIIWQDSYIGTEGAVERCGTDEQNCHQQGTALS